MLVIAMVGMIYVWYAYLMSPLEKNIKKKTDELGRIKSEIQNLKAQSAELPRIKQHVEYLKTEVAELEEYLPREKELPALLKAITKTAGNYQVRVMSISPAGSSPKQNYTEHLFGMTVQGSYHSVAKFLAEIGQTGRIISAKNLAFSPLVGGSKDITVSVSFQLVAYTYKG